MTGGLRRFLKATVGAVALTATLGHAHGQVEFKLGSDDEWMTPATADPGSAQSQLRQAQLALVHGEAQRAFNLASGWLDRFPADPLRAHALLLKGDALLAQGEEYKALYEYEDLARKYPGSDTVVTALQREYSIAVAYTNGLRRKFFGTFRWLNAEDDAQELLIRIQERLPGSELAEQAGMTLADYYFRQRDLQLAAEAYDLFVKNYPRSRQVEKAKLRLIYALFASYKGPLYDARGLFEASSHLKTLVATDPVTAQRVGADALLVRIYESEASKLLSEASWYASIDDPISAEVFIRRLVKTYPKSIATLIALRDIPALMAKLPATMESLRADYDTMRREMLGLAWDGAPAPVAAPKVPTP